MGYMVSTHLLQASDFGAPQRRSRWYIIAIRPGGRTSSSMSSTSSVRSSSSQNPSSFQSRVADVLSACQLPQLPVEAVLLPAGSPSVKAWLGTFRSGPSSSKRFVPSKWEELHKNYFQAQGLPWPAELEPAQQQSLAEAVHGSSLTEREASVLTFLFLSNCQASVVDLSQSINRLPMATGMTPTVMPSGGLFSLGQMRFLTPPELFALQGLPFHALADPSSSVSSLSFNAPTACKGRKRGGTSTSSSESSEASWAFLAELAGNAFCGHCAAACLIAVLACV